MEQAQVKLALDPIFYPGSLFSREGTAMELELRISVQSLREYGAASNLSIGWTRGGAVELQMPSQPVTNITRFRFLSSGRNSPWIKPNPFQ